MNKENAVHTHGRVLISHKKEILPLVTAQMNLEGILPSEISPRKTHTARSHLYVESKKKTLIETERRMVVARD